MKRITSPRSARGMSDAVGYQERALAVTYDTMTYSLWFPVDSSKAADLPVCARKPWAACTPCALACRLDPLRHGARSG